MNGAAKAAIRIPALGIAILICSLSEVHAAGITGFWSDDFNPPGVDGVGRVDVRSLVTLRQEVYVGGVFISVGNTMANNIAKWDGRAWSNLGEGLNTIAQHLAVDDPYVYVVGRGQSASGANTNRVLKWDGNQWLPLFTSLSDADLLNIRSIAVFRGDLIVAGSFSALAATAANNIARWDGNNWVDLGGGLCGSVGDLLVHNDELYAGGFFSCAGTNVLKTSMLKWDGQKWMTVGTIPNDTVNALVVSGNDIYAGGRVPLGPTGGIGGIAKWDGTNWSVVASGLEGGFIETIAVLNDDLYVGGTFRFAGGQPIMALAKWNGNNWSLVGGGLSSTISGTEPRVATLAVNKNRLFVGGLFGAAGDAQALHIAEWDGTNWLRDTVSAGAGLGRPLFADVFSVASISNKLYSLGMFAVKGARIFSGVAEWVPPNWVPLGSIYPEGVLSTFGGHLYVGAEFESIGGITASNIAFWDGRSWNSLSQGLDGKVRALAAGPQELYAGGDFQYAGTIPVNRVAIWNGSEWRSMNEGIQGEPSETFVSALAVKDTLAYVGGRFNRAGTLTTSNVAAWDGSRWHALGNGIAAPVTALATVGNLLYAGTAQFELLSWNGSVWSRVSSFNNRLNAFATIDNSLIAGGDFTEADGIRLSYIGRWDGAAWQPLGSGLNFRVNAIFSENKGVLVGGPFHYAGGRPSSLIARWHHFDHPSLAIARNDKALEIRWSDAVLGFELQQTTNIWDNQWQLSPQNSTTNNGERVLPVSPVGTQFYRLVR